MKSLEKSRMWRGSPPAIDPGTCQVEEALRFAAGGGSVLGLMAKTRGRVSAPRFVVCIDNSNYEASLELHKIYAVVRDADALQDGDLRVVDESGEDYLYSAGRFVTIEIPKALERARFKKAS